MRACKCRQSLTWQGLYGAWALVHIFAAEAVDEGAGEGDEEGEAQLGVVVGGDAQVEAAGLLGVEAAAAGHLRLRGGGELRGQVARDGHVVPEVHEGCAHDHLHRDTRTGHPADHSCLRHAPILDVLAASMSEARAAHVQIVTVPGSVGHR